MPKKPKLDAFSAHEALDRSHLAAAFFGDHVAEHPYLQTDAELKRAAEKLAEQLADFYQLVGRRVMRD